MLDAVGVRSTMLLLLRVAENMVNVGHVEHRIYQLIWGIDLGDPRCVSCAPVTCYHLHQENGSPSRAQAVSRQREGFGKGVVGEYPQN